MVSQFVHNRVAKRKQSFSADFVFEKIEIVESDDSCVFHGPPFVFMSENLIILRKRIVVPKIFLKKLHRKQCDLFNKRPQIHQLRVQGLNRI